MQQPVPMHVTFSEALEKIKMGHKAFRAGWNGSGLHVKLQMPDAHSKMSLPYIYIEYPVGSKTYPTGARVPWLASQTDLLMDDWIVAA